MKNTIAIKKVAGHLPTKARTALGSVSKIAAFINGFKYAFNGLIFFFGNDRNGRIQLLAATGVVLMGLVLHLRVMEWIAILGCIAIVLSFEMLNSGIERLCDIVQPEYHFSIKIIKDVAAGAVLWTAVISAIIGTIIFLPKLLSFL